MNTLYLDPQTWDLTVDASGNIAMASDPYAIAQDVASACRLWQGEALFDTSRGVPYKASVLGQRPPVAMLTEWFRTEAKTVPGVVDATPILIFENRQLSGQIQITTETETINVNIAN